MEEKELKHVIALLLEDAKRRQELEPNAGTAARIEGAKAALATHTEEINDVYLDAAVITKANR